MKRGFPQVPQQQQTKAGGNKLKLDYSKIKKGDIVAITKDGGYTQSEVNSNTQIHQKSMTPLTPDGDFRIECHEAVMFSNILLSRFQKKNEMTGQMENQLTLKTFMEIYGNYGVPDADGNPTTDEIGDSYANAFNLIDESIAESIDANPAHKKSLMGLLKLGNKQKAALEAPMIGAMEPFLKRATIEDTTSPNVGEEDMSKSPTGAFQLWIGTPKVPSVTDFKIPGTNLVIWTKIFDDTGDRVSSKPISTWDHLMRFIYEKGDSQTKGRRPFRFSSTCSLLAPSLYINSEKRVGRIQYKMLEMHIYEIDHPKARNVMSTEEMSVQRAHKMKALGRFVTNPEPETTETDLSTTGDQGYEQSYPQDDQQAQYEQQDSGENQVSSELDSLIDADQDMQRVTRKQRHG
jgi:hypothetical protein